VGVEIEVGQPGALVAAEEVGAAVAQAVAREPNVGRVSCARSVPGVMKTCGASARCAR